MQENMLVTEYVVENLPDSNTEICHQLFHLSKLQV